MSQLLVLLWIGILLVGSSVGSHTGGCADCSSSEYCCTDRLDHGWCCAEGTSCDASSRGCMARSEQTSDLQQSFTMVYFTWGFLFKMSLVLLALSVSAFSISYGYVRARYVIMQVLQRIEQQHQAEESSDEAVSEGESEELIPTASHTTTPSLSSSSITEGHCSRCGNAIDCVLLRCSHAVVCYRCARRLRDCPTCETKIHRRQRLFYA